MIQASLPTRCGSKRKWNDTPSIIVRRFQAKMTSVSSSQKKQCLTTGIADILEQPVSKDALYECICSLSSIVDQSWHDDESFLTCPSFDEMEGF
jgi:hypothetical protein